MLRLVGTIFSTLFLGGALAKEKIQENMVEDQLQRNSEARQDFDRSELYRDLKTAKDRGLVYSESEQIKYMECYRLNAVPRELTEAEVEKYKEHIFTKGFNREKYTRWCFMNFRGAYQKADLYRELYEAAGYYWSRRTERNYFLKKYCTCKTMEDYSKLRREF